jgi:predicted amidohydrolase YtcJ
MHADCVFVNGEVVTVNPRDDVFEAVAVRGNKICAVGTTEEILRLQGPATRVVDLGGNSLLPGFVDSHLHMLMYGTDRLGVDCKNGVREVADITARLARRARETPPGGWVRGWGYNHQRLAEGRHPTREDLDRVSQEQEHPVIVVRTCNHISAVNSRALEVLGITRDTPDPEGGTIARDEDGEPTGVLKETAHMTAFEASRYSPSEMREALSIANHEFLRLGITSVHDAGGYGPEQMRIMYQTVAAGLVKVRIYAMVCSLNRSEEFVRRAIDAGLVNGMGDERFRIGPAKIFTDGSSSGPTCATREPYTSDPNDYGILYYTQEQIDGILGEAHRNGFQITAHAIGEDKAVEMVTDCIEKALREHPRGDHRHRIEHAGMVPPDLMERIEKLGIIPIPNPAFFYEFGEGYLKNHGERVEHMFPMSEYSRRGIIVAAGSDTPVTVANPLRGIYCAVTRNTESGVPVGEDQKVSVLEAVRAFTYNGAYASFEEERKGSIEVGKLADLVVLDGSILSSSPKEILSLRCVLTMIDGEVVFRGESDRDLERRGDLAPAADTAD